MFEEERIYEDLVPALRKCRTVFIIFLVLVFLMISYYWKIQILGCGKYWRMAENNRTRMRPVSAPRGLITDRNGLILADNRATFKILLFRENMKDMENRLKAISHLVKLDESELRSRLERYKGVPVYESVVIKDGLSLAEAALVESRRLEFPELLVDGESQRYYPRGVLAAHVLGYLQERTLEEIKSDPERKLKIADLGGKSGIESIYDGMLTGQAGFFVEVVDSLGRSRGELARTAPVPGREIRLSLDVRLQELAEKLLLGREGAVVVLDNNNGEVLAMASSPTFDPNKFITRFTPGEWEALASDPASPMENRAERGLYAPGSIFKLVMALGGLSGGYIDERTGVYCSGSTEIYGVRFGCWFKPGHGLVRLADAIKNSCNIYFYELGRRMGIDNIAVAARRLGLGSLTGIDLPGEKNGLVPDSEWKRNVLKEPWYLGETIPVSIGQGQLQVTPLQLASLVGNIANRGRQVRPHLFLEETGIPGQGRFPQAKLPDVYQPFQPGLYEKVIDGMWRSVNEDGTGREAKIAGLDICGKTGSTQVLSRESLEKLAKLGKEVKTHSWFCGFAPRNNPRVAVAVLVERGGGGSVTAAPMARQLFDMYFNGDEVRDDH